MKTKTKFIRWFLVPSFVICYLSFVISAASAACYDGIWFLGFNLEKEPFNNVYVRQAAAHAINKQTILRLASEEVSPGSVIPPGMSGYRTDLAPYSFNLKQAKVLMRRGKYLPVHPKLKKITLLHTDGIRTVAIAKEIKKELKELGMNITLIQVKYDDKAWNDELNSRRHHLYLLGYKADFTQSLTREAAPDVVDTYKLLEPLFHTGGAANVNSFSNSTVDMLLDQVSVISVAYQVERELKLKEVNKVLYQELPALVLFYIPKL
ncbi:MAG: ABC transporter substrate-binding protein [Candidatus Margulisiibacteriota bacterium]|jgi:ABC-type transport system substrate-binding protein